MYYKHTPSVRLIGRIGFIFGFLASFSPLFALPSRLTIPEATVETLEGQPVTLGLPQTQGRLLVFVKSWCGECQDELTAIREIGSYFSPDDLEVVVVAAGESREQAALLTEVLPRAWVFADPSGLAAVQYRIRRVPQFFYQGRTGQFQPVQSVTIETIWDLLAGNEPSGARLEPSFLRNFTRPAEDAPRLRRLIVEIDEKVETRQRLKPGEQLAARRELIAASAQKLGARIIHTYGRLKGRVVLEVDESRLSRLRRLPGFRMMREDPPVKALLEDSAYQIKAHYAWSNAITGEGVKVAVVDTGIDYNHPDLRNRVVAQFDATTGGDDAMDDNGHGTHVAGIIASQGTKYRGISYDVSLMGVKVLDSGGAGYASDVILGIEWAVANGADVINLSLGEGLYSSTCDYTEMAQTVNAAVEAGVVVVCASGNDSKPSQIVSPACASRAIAVGSVDKMDGVASYSDGGAELDLVAPGGDTFGGTNFPEIIAPFSSLVAEDPYLCLYFVQDVCYDDYFVVDNKRYIRAVGTSMAAPHVAGAAALLLEANPDLSAAQIKETLQANADDLGAPGWDPIYGWGRINLERALDSVPAGLAELTVRLSEPNAAQPLTVNDLFQLLAEVECRGGDGCGEVRVVAEFSEQSDTTGFGPIGPATVLSTADPNPVNLGSLSGTATETEAALIYDLSTVFDPTPGTYGKTAAPAQAPIGSQLMPRYQTGDLEPDDALGAIGENVEKLYAFTLPEGVIRKFSVRMEHYMVIHFDGDYNGWLVYTSDAAGATRHLLGDCIVAEGGGGQEQPPDCWWVSEDPAVLAGLNPGGLNHILIRSHGVGPEDWLTFNDIEVIVDYQPDPDQDEARRYLVAFDLGGIDPNYPVTAARLNLGIDASATGAVGELYLVDNTLTEQSDAALLHNPARAGYSSLLNPIKTLAVDQAGLQRLSLKAAVEEALAAGQTRLALQVREQDENGVFTLAGSGAAGGPSLSISQLMPASQPARPGLILAQTPLISPDGPIQPRLAPLYDTLVTRSATTDRYAKTDAPATAAIGAPFIMEYQTGNLEPEQGVDAIGKNVAKVYEFALPPGILREVRVRMKHYLVLHTSSIESGWYVYVSDAAGAERFLIGDCIPAEGGGGEAPPPDCWFTLTDPAGLALLNSGGSNHIKLASHHVGPEDWLTFDAIEVTALYAIDGEQDRIGRYYVQFDLAGLPAGATIDSARLHLFVTDPGVAAQASIHVVDHRYDSQTGAVTLYDPADAPYTSLTNPYKTFAIDSAGLYLTSVKPALEDALESGAEAIAFLVTEQDENALFTLDGSGGAQPPQLEIFFKSGVTAGSAGWSVLPTLEGRYQVRVRAEGSVGVRGEKTMSIDVTNPWTPFVGPIECRSGGLWQDCTKLGHGSVIEAIRAQAGDPQEVPVVSLSLEHLDARCPPNQPGCGLRLSGTATPGGGLFTLNGPATLDRSGQWRILARARDSEGNSKEKSIHWTLPWGRLQTTLRDPNGPFSLRKGTGRTLQARIDCLEGDCPEVRAGAILNDPVVLSYDDGDAEDYGDIGDIGGYLAVKLTPVEYPASLKIAQVFVYDQTAYPFYLHVWDDNGSGGAPGTELMPPLFVQPSVYSMSQPPPPMVGWFPIDLSAQHITLTSGSFYIGFSHISNSQLNSVGFDTGGPRFQRSWGYLNLFGSGFWFNLNDYCGFDPQYCGNLMIRAILGEPGAFAGPLPAGPGAAPFYTLSPAGIDLAPGQSALIDLGLYATGQGPQSGQLTVTMANRYNAGKANPVTVSLLPPANPFEAANLDARGGVDLDDLALLSTHWLTAGTGLNSDINANQSVDLPDLVLLAQMWLNR